MSKWHVHVFNNPSLKPCSLSNHDPVVSLWSAESVHIRDGTLPCEVSGFSQVQHLDVWVGQVFFFDCLRLLNLNTSCISIPVSKIRHHFVGYISDRLYITLHRFILLVLMNSRYCRSGTECGQVIYVMCSPEQRKNNNKNEQFVFLS